MGFRFLITEVTLREIKWDVVARKLHYLDVLCIVDMPEKGCTTRRYNCSFVVRRIDFVLWWSCHVGEGDNTRVSDDRKALYVFDWMHVTCERCLSPLFSSPQHSQWTPSRPQFKTGFNNAVTQVDPLGLSQLKSRVARIKYRGQRGHRVQHGLLNRVVNSRSPRGGKLTLSNITRSMPTIPVMHSDLLASVCSTQWH